MRRDPRAYLWDALQALELVQGFMAGRSLVEYQAEPMLRSAVERQLEIVGEALNQLSKVAPELAGSVPELRRIVGLRNVLIHGYTSVDDQLVWQVATRRVPDLVGVLRDLLVREGGAS